MADAGIDPSTPDEAGSNDKDLPLSDRAYRRLRRQILDGLIPPEGKLKLDVLQRQLSLSSSPLREALNRLLAEGLVQSDDHRGFRASPMSTISSGRTGTSTPNSGTEVGTCAVVSIS